MAIRMMMSSLRPGASMCTAAGWPRYARLKANALGQRRSQKCYTGVRWSCEIHKPTISKSDGQTVRRSYGQTARGSNVQTARRQDGLRMSKAAYDDLKRSDTV